MYRNKKASSIILTEDMNTYKQTDNPIELKNPFSEGLGGLLDKYIVHTPRSLFEPTAWDKKYWLLQKRCPLCQRKLKIDLKGNGRCTSKFKDKFFIKSDSLKKYA